MSNGKIFLLDGMALIYRAFFAFIQNPRITSTGLNASAMMGFTNTLLEVIKKQKPTHLAVVFDTSAPTQRHIQFEAYKAQREEMPEDLRKSIPYIFRIIEGFNIPVITMDGYEADDIIGTLAWKAGDLGYDVFMMTPDKDFGQLVRDNVKIYKPARMGNGDEILGVEEILKKWEITDPKQVIDILGLWGDASDNIPGVPGVGEKTAKKLIQEYGSMEAILENIDKLKGKMQENFRNFTEQAKVSKWLATIDTQVPIALDLEALKMEPVNEPALREVFEELEFRTLMRRVLGESGGSAEASADSRIGDSSPSRSGGVDLFGNPIAPASPKKVKPQPANQTSMFDQVLEDSESVSEEEVAVYKTIQDVAHEYRIADTEESLLAIAQNIKYDITVLQNYGVTVAGPMFDTMLAHYLLEPDQRHNMQLLSEKFLGYTPVSIETLIGKKGKSQGSMRDVELSAIAEYAAEDADVTFQLYGILKPALEERGLMGLLMDVEMPLVLVLEAMERQGVRVDVDFLKDYSNQLLEQVRGVQASIFQEAGGVFNIASAQQVGTILFDKLKLSDKPKKTKTGQYQTDEETLNALLGKHPIVQHIMDFRALQKLKSTYVDALPLLVDAQSGRVHTGMQEAFKQGLDIHTATAAKVWGVNLEEVDKEMRRKAKTVNFGIIYGISAFGLSQRVGISRGEAKEIIENYFKQFGGVKEYMDDTVNKAREQGYVETILGRRRYMRDILSANAVMRGFAERNAINAPIQGSAADMIKVAMIQIHDWLNAEKLKSRMILQVHDELLFDVPAEELAYVEPKVIALMEGAMKLDVPVLVESGKGNNWLEAH